MRGVYEDIINNKYGYLTVINEIKGKHPKCECLCDCGNTIIKRKESLDNDSMCRECYKLYLKGAILSPTGKLHPNIKNEIGNKYNKLTVVDIDCNNLNTRGVTWRCQCDCGNYVSVLGHNLRNNSITSCGCNHAIIEERGTKFGFLTIVKRIENSSAGKVRYLCQCDCGAYCKVVGGDLRNGNQISCGCIKSKGEEKIISILLNNNIKFEKEAKFDTCKDKKMLPFDFKVNSNDGFYLIEYDGKQHFDVKHAWSTYDYEKNLKHDKIKNDWCKNNNIKLIRIPYTRLDKLCLEDLLVDSSQYVV